MAMYRKKPVVIEAVQYQHNDQHRNNADPLLKCLCSCGDGPRTPMSSVHIHTLEGAHCVSPGDYIIKGIKGEFYPCKPDIFAETHEPA